MSRRVLLVGAPALVLVRGAWAADEGVGVLYGGWHEAIGGALDALEGVVEGLGTDQAALEIVRDGAGRWGALGRYGLSSSETAALAAEHAGRLADQTGAEADELTVVVKLSSVSRVYNVSYGLGPNLDALVKRYAEIGRLLGSGVLRALVIEQTPTGSFALVYKRYGDLDGTQVVAARHAKLLAPHGLSASYIQERHNAIVYDGTTVRLPPPRVEPPPPFAPAAAEPPPAAGVAEPGVEPVEPSDVDGEPSALGVAVAAVAEPAPRTLPPLPAPPGPVRPLGAGDTQLEKDVEAWIKDQRALGRVSSAEVTSWLVHDLESDETLCSINADEPRQAASMVKPLVMLAFFHEVKRERFIYGPESTARFEAMIQRSSNSATNWAFDQIGGPGAVQRILDEHYGDLFVNTSIVERIADGGRTYRNKASAADYVRYLRALWRDELPESAEQKRLLNLPGRDRLYSDVPAVPSGTLVYDKTGSTARLCGDMGILVVPRVAGPAVPYAIVGIIQRNTSVSNYGSWISARGDVIRGVSGLAYAFLKAAKGLV